MKYLLLIASLAACLVASPVSAQTNACCKGKQCCNSGCCKKQPRRLLRITTPSLGKPGEGVRLIRVTEPGHAASSTTQAIA